MNRALRGLLKRKTELPMALEIKQARWPAEKSVELLERLQGRRPRLHPDTIAALQSHIQSFECPISRHAGLAQLSKIGHIDPVLAASSHAHYGEFEQAISLGYTSTLDNAKIRALLGIGAVQEVVDLVLASDYTLDPEIWNALVQTLVQAKEYTRAQSIWFRKPFNAKAPYWTVRQLFILAAQNRDAEMVAELEPHIARKGDKALQHYLLDVFDDPKLLLAALRQHKSAEGGGNLLAQNVMEILPHLSNEPTGLYNSILQGCMNHYTSLFVFGVYRYLLTTGFTPNSTSAQILANACFRLGNSKILSFQVWNEIVEVQRIEPTQRFYETLIKSQFSGTGVRTCLFFLNQMRARGVFLRNDLHFQLIGQFRDDSVYTQLYGDFRRLAEYAVWDHQLAADESGKYAAQAQRNADAFCTDKTLQDLHGMYEFEQNQRRKATVTPPRLRLHTDLLDQRKIREGEKI